MAITLFVEDDQNGTSVNYEVSQTGVAFTTDVTIYASSFGGEEITGPASGVESFQLNGVDSQSGTINMAVGGYLWTATAVSIADSHVAVSNFAYVAVTTFGLNDSDIHNWILDTVVAMLKTLSLPGQDPDDIYRVKRPDYPEGTAYPNIQVSAIGTEEYDPQVITFDDKGYPVVITLAEKMNDDNSDDGNMLRRRQIIMKKLMYPKLVGVPPVLRSAVVPDAIMLPGALDAKIHAGIIGVRYYVREQRG